MNIQYKKGVLDLLVLCMLNKEDRYGYDVSETISRSISISAGTIYPILRKLKEDGLVTTYLSEDSNGPARKYYRITTKGANELAKTKQEWNDFVTKVSIIMEENDND
ncbi:MAG: PadR family transcriptional regulator [Candidatus Izemoplasmatales bacterium]